MAYTTSGDISRTTCAADIRVKPARTRLVPAELVKCPLKKQRRECSPCVLYGACFSRIKFTASAHRGLTVLRRGHINKRDLASAEVSRPKVSFIEYHLPIKTRGWHVTNHLTEKWVSCDRYSNVVISALESFRLKLWRFKFYTQFNHHPVSSVSSRHKYHSST